MNRKNKLVSIAAIFAMGLSFGTEATAKTAKAELRDRSNDKVGEVTLTDRKDKVEVSIKANSLPSGFHGFHIHAVGDCSASDFTSAGGHFNPGGKQHGHHAGDLPNLLVMADGTGSMTLKTDRFEVADLFDEDGSAVIIHARADNHANIPERYQPPVDEATLATGDAGARLACGVIKQ